MTYREDDPISFNPFYTDTGEFDVEKRESIKTLILTLWKREDEPPRRSEESCAVWSGERLHPQDNREPADWRLQRLLRVRA